MQFLAPAVSPPMLRQVPTTVSAATMLPDVTVMFTDLGGSTALYDRLGDHGAFILVRQHFAELRAAIHNAGGTVVKTIGDSVMAVFSWPGAAVRMALAALDETDAPLQLKVGIHRGPVIAATLEDGRPDYFGQTVNIAARLRGLAGPGGALCLTHNVRLAPGVSELLAGLPIAAEVSRLAGAAGPPLMVFRLGPPGLPPLGDAVAA
jgi:class 3 adenylate cyclase